MSGICCTEIHITTSINTRRHEPPRVVNECFGTDTTNGDW